MGTAGAANDYAKMVEFSRHRREQLKASGQQRRGGGRGGRNGKGKQSAPRAFGTNDHGPGMKPHEVRPPTHELFLVRTRRQSLDSSRLSLQLCFNWSLQRFG